MHPSLSRPAEVLFLLALAGANAGVSLRCVEAMLPKLAADFGTTVPAAATIITSFAFAYTGSVLLQGPLGDRFGKLRVVTIAGALAGCASLACAFAWDIGSLAGLRFITGLFASASVALGMAYIGDVVPVAERQATIARFIAGSLLGQALGPLFGGVFTDWLGWRMSFLFLGVVFLLVSLILLVRTAPVWPARVPGPFRPLAVHRELLGRVAVRWLVLVGALETFFFFGAFVYLGVYFKERFDVSYTVLGLILAGFGIGGLLYSACVRWLLAALGERGLVVAGGMLGGTLFVAVLFVPHWAWAMPCTIGLGVSFYFIHNTIQMKVTEVAPEARGSAVALYSSAWGLGQALGVTAMGVAMSSFSLAPFIVLFGLGWCALGWWLRSNLWRLRHA